MTNEPIADLIDRLFVIQKQIAHPHHKGEISLAINKLHELETENKRLKGSDKDALKWRSIMNCDRVRIMGRTYDNNHIGLELWREHPLKHPCEKYPQDNCRKLLEGFAK